MLEPLSSLTVASTTTPGGWSALSKIARSVAIGSFEPNGSTQSKYGLADLGIGDEVYLFETHKSGKWARGYVIKLPKTQAVFSQMGPRNLKTKEAPLSPLDINLTVGIVPLSHVCIKEYFQINSPVGSGSSTSDKKNSSMSMQKQLHNDMASIRSSIILKANTNAMARNNRYSEVTTSTDYETESIDPHTLSMMSNTSTSTNGKGLLQHQQYSNNKRGSIDSFNDDHEEDTTRPPPAVPYLRLGTETPTLANEPLVDDISSVIKEWFFTYLYHYYLEGEYALVAKVIDAIKDLYVIRRKLLYGLLTSTERIMARRKAIWQFSRISKLLKRGIVVRDNVTGAILGLDEEDGGPVKLAQEQMMLALAPDYPNHAVATNAVKTAYFPKHILVDFKSVVGEIKSRRLYVRMYLRTKTQQLTEVFQIHIKPDTIVADLSAVLFRDLPLSITKDDVFLVAAVYEDVSLKNPSSGPVPINQFLPNNGNNAASNSNTNNSANPNSAAGAHHSSYPNKTSGRRGIAAGAADISRLFRMDESVESPFTIRMFSNYFSSDEPSDENRGWGEIIDRIIRGRPKGVAITPKAEQVVCTVKEFEAASISGISQYLEHDTERSIGLAQSLFVNSLSEFRNDIYFHLGKVSLVGNIQSRVRDLMLINFTSKSGAAKFSDSTNGEATSSRDSLAAFNEEVIGDLIKVTDFSTNDSIMMTLYLGGIYLGSGSINIWDGSRVISGKTTVNFTRDGYSVATLQVLVDFIGNGYNTDIAIEKILHWKTVYDSAVSNISASNSSTEEIISTLRHFSSVEESEFLKQFHDLMDCLLDMLGHFLTSGNDKLLLAIFEALVITLEKTSTRSSFYVYLADDYLTNRFNFGGLSDTLLTLYGKTIMNDNSPGHQDLIPVFKVAKHIAKLASASGKIDSDRSEDAQLYVGASASNIVKRITDSIKELVSLVGTKYVSMQMACVKNLFDFYFELKELIPDEEFASLLIEATDMVRQDVDKINTERLLLIRRLSKPDIYGQSKFRSHIAAYTIKWTLQFWIDTRDFNQQRKVQIRLLSGIFAKQFNILWPLRQQQQQEVDDVCKRYVQLLPLVAKLFIRLLGDFENNHKQNCTVYSPLFPEEYPFESRAVDSVVRNSVFDEALIELGIVFTLLVNIANFSGEQLSEIKFTSEQFTELAFNVIRACTAMLDNTAFPKTWVSLRATQHETVFGCLEYLSTLMVSKFIPPPDQAEAFNSDLWYAYIQCILRLTGSELMAVEHLSEQKRTAVWKISKDLRGRASLLLKKMWDSIGWKAHEEDQMRFGIDVYGGYQVQLYGGETSLVNDIMATCLVRHRVTQTVAVQILYSMIIGEWTLNSDFTGLQREIVISLDELFQSKAFIPEFYEKQMFIKCLKDTIAPLDPEDEAYNSVMKLVDDIEEFLDLLLDLYSIPPGDAYNDDRIFHALNVLNFLKDIDRVEIFSRYVYDIAEWNKIKSNLTQAGLAYRLLASAYEWSYGQNVEANEQLKLPAQTAFERKVALYEKAIAFFTRGKAYENAIDATKELMNAYETVAFDFKQLVAYTSVLGKLYSEVDNSERLSPQYFRVAYMGQGFPRSLRDRQFIFEGTPWEKLESIHDRLHQLYPGATIVNSEDMTKGDGQYLYVSVITPENVSVLNNNGAHPSVVSSGAREFQARLNLKYFSYSRPLPGNTSPLDLWVEKTIYETYQTFPTIVKRSEVKNVTVIKLSPLQNALELLDGKINELVELETQFASGRANQSTVTQLNLVLSGSIDSPVNGGIQVYRAFLEDDNLKNDPVNGALVQVLDGAFLDYAYAIERCLSIHGKVVPASLKPLHKSLVELFERNFAPELTALTAERDQQVGSTLSRTSTNSTTMSINTMRRSTSSNIARLSYGQTPITPLSETSLLSQSRRVSSDQASSIFGAPNGGTSLRTNSIASGLNGLPSYRSSSIGGISENGGGGSYNTSYASHTGSQTNSNILLRSPFGRSKSNAQASADGANGANGHGRTESKDSRFSFVRRNVSGVR